jgi:hypothetical protein
MSEITIPYLIQCISPSTISVTEATLKQLEEFTAMQQYSYIDIIHAVARRELFKILSTSYRDPAELVVLEKCTLETILERLKEPHFGVCRSALELNHLTT